MGKKKEEGKPENPAQNVIQQAQTRYDSTTTPSATETEMGPLSQGMANNYNTAVGQNTADYGNIMGQYNQFRSGLAQPTKFSAPNPKELQESYGLMRQAVPGYQDFAKTGGYSGQDIQELRARGIAPIRAAYGNTMMEMDRARSLGGGGGSPNYIAATSKAQRDMPGQMADAMTGVNAGLAESIRHGKQVGLAGLSGIGGQMGSQAGAAAGRDLQAQQMSEQSRQNRQQMDLAGIGGQASIYGTTPGLSSMFGNQALNSYQSRAGMEQARNQFGMSMLDAQLRGFGAEEAAKGDPWWRTALHVAAVAAPYVAMAASDQDMKTDARGVPMDDNLYAESSRYIKKNISPKSVEGSNFTKKLKELQLYTWKYKDDPSKTTHFGPMAQEFKEKFNIGDGKTIHLADVMGVVLASQKEAVKDA